METVKGVGTQKVPEHQSREKAVWLKAGKGRRSGDSRAEPRFLNMTDA